MEKFESLSLDEICDGDALQEVLADYGKIKEIYIEKITLRKGYDANKITIWYYIALSNSKLRVKVTYINVTNFILDDHWSNLPEGILHHVYNSTWEHGKYHIFDISSSYDTTDTISFYCDEFLIDFIKEL